MIDEVSYFLYDEINQIKGQLFQLEKYCKFIQHQHNNLIEQNQILWRYLKDKYLFLQIVRGNSGLDYEQMMKSLSTDISLDSDLFEKNPNKKIKDETNQSIKLNEQLCVSDN